MYNLNRHRSFDLCKLVDARRRAWSERAFRLIAETDSHPSC